MLQLMDSDDTILGKKFGDGGCSFAEDAVGSGGITIVMHVRIR
jgi:hypothetical protein